MIRGSEVGTAVRGAERYARSVAGAAGCRRFAAPTRRTHHVDHVDVVLARLPANDASISRACTATRPRGGVDTSQSEPGRGLERAHPGKPYVLSEFAMHRHGRPRPAGLAETAIMLACCRSTPRWRQVDAQRHAPGFTRASARSARSGWTAAQAGVGALAALRPISVRWRRARRCQTRRRSGYRCRYVYRAADAVFLGARKSRWRGQLRSGGPAQLFVSERAEPRAHLASASLTQHRPDQMFGAGLSKTTPSPRTAVSIVTRDPKGVKLALHLEATSCASANRWPTPRLRRRGGHFFTQTNAQRLTRWLSVTDEAGPAVAAFQELAASMSSATR